MVLLAVVGLLAGQPALSAPPADDAPFLAQPRPGVTRPAAAGTIQGTIYLEHLLVSAVRPQDVLYIIAFAADAPPGSPPVAVKKIAPPVFPVDFVLSRQDVMQEQLFEGRMIISARVDKDGDAGGRIGDLEGSYPGNPVAVGTTGVDIVIDRIR